MKIELSAVGKMYCVCALLTNGHTCLYRSMTSNFFDIEPPTLEEYFYRSIENIFAEPRENSLWERFYMIFNPVLPLYRNQLINFHWKPINWFLYNSKAGLKLVEEMKDP